ncbi:hypothetical protein VP01_42g2 [Puccinia sorghi]|uniref:Uncharacterized protein n=1 Tax=Puccinia sorghi TaxID=27349 RepID=A0A0L6UQ44_9BASI|nr:hypothetical protein VP01_42g2 [Puccinia sorghi]
MLVVSVVQVEVKKVEGMGFILLPCHSRIHQDHCCQSSSTHQKNKSSQNTQDQQVTVIINTQNKKIFTHHNINSTSVSISWNSNSGGAYTRNTESDRQLIILVVYSFYFMLLNLLLLSVVVQSFHCCCLIVLCVFPCTYCLFPSFFIIPHVTHLSPSIQNLFIKYARHTHLSVPQISHFKYFSLIYCLKFNIFINSSVTRKTRVSRIITGLLRLTQSMQNKRREIKVKETDKQQQGVQNHPVRIEKKRRRKYEQESSERALASGSKVFTWSDFLAGVMIKLNIFNAHNKNISNLIYYKSFWTCLLYIRLKRRISYHWCNLKNQSWCKLQTNSFHIVHLFESQSLTSQLDCAGDLAPLSSDVYQAFPGFERVETRKKKFLDRNSWCSPLDAFTSLVFGEIGMFLKILIFHDAFVSPRSSIVNVADMVFLKQGKSLLMIIISSI